MIANPLQKRRTFDDALRTDGGYISNQYTKTRDEAASRLALVCRKPAPKQLKRGRQTKNELATIILSTLK